MAISSFRNINLTEGVIWKQLVRFAIPLLMTNFLQQLYNAADLMIVGRYAGKLSMAGVGATGSVSFMLIGLFMGLATGASVIVAQHYGAGDNRNLAYAVHTAYALALVSGLVLTVAGWFLAPTLLTAMKTPADVFPFAVTYMRIFFLGIVPLMVYNMGAGILRSVGNSKSPFIFLLISSILNIALDLIFIRVFDMGIAGAAWATVIAQIVSMILVTINLMNSTGAYRLFLRDIRLHKDVIGRIVNVGIPAGMQSVVISLSNVLIQSKINSFGPNAIAGIAAAGRVDGFIFTGLQAFALAATTFSGQNLGAKLYDRLRRGAKSALILVVLTALSLGAIIILVRYPTVGLFTEDPEVVEIGVRMIMTLAPAYWIFGMSEVLGGFIRGAGKAVIPMSITIFTMCGLRMVWLYAVLPLWRSIDVIMLSYPISWTLTFTMMALFFRFGKWLPDDARRKLRHGKHKEA